MPDFAQHHASSLRSWFSYAAIFTATLFVSWIGNDRSALWDRDEPRYAETAKQMLRRGDFIVPYFNDEFRFQKPAMTYWLIAGVYAAIGESDFAARALAGLCLAGSAVLAAWTANRLFGSPAGWLAAAMLVLSPMGLILGKLALPDGPQLLCAAVCLAAMARTYRAETSAPLVWQSAFWIALACSILVKGPILLAMIACTLLAFGLLRRESPSAFRLGWRWGPALALLMALPWIIAVYAAVGPAFFTEAVGKQLARRLGESFDGRFYPPVYYAATSLVCLAPWTGFVLLALIRERTKLRSSPPHALLISWIVGPMVLVECFRSKQPHYFAPAYPALAIFTAGHFAPLLRRETFWKWDFVGKSAPTWNAVFGVAGLAAAIYMGRFLQPNTAIWAWIAGAVCGAAGIGGAVLLYRNRPRLATLVQGVGQFAVLAVVGGAVLPAMNAERIAKPIAQILAQEPQTPAYGFACVEPSMVYYGRTIHDAAERQELLVEMRSADRDFLVAVPRQYLPELAARVPGAYRIESTHKGWIRMHRDEVLVVRFLRGESAENAAARALPVRR